MEVTTRNRAELKSYFVKNSIPTESQFAELIEGMLNQRDDGVVKLPDDPLSIAAAGDAASEKKALHFYRDFAEPAPDWTLSLNTADGPGLNISDGAGNTRLFIDRSSGNIGIGSTAPGAKLDVQQEDRSGNHPSAGKALYVTGNFSPDGNGVEFRHSNGTQGIGFGYGTIYATGSNANQSLELRPRGSGVIRARGPLHVTGAITPAAGNSAVAGIMFPKDPGGGSGDAAFIRYYPRKGEATTFEIGTTNDVNDHIALMPSGNVGIGTVNPSAKLEIVASRTTAGGWFEAIRFGRTEHSAITHPGGGLLFGLHGNRNFYFADIKGGQFQKYVMTINAQNGNVTIPRLLVANKWLFSDTRNDDWLRIFGPNNNTYFGGLAAGKLWTSSGGGLVKTSDVRAKENIEPVANALDRVMALRGVNFDWRSSDFGRGMGLIAQEVEDIFPEAVQDGPDGLKGIDYSNLMAPLIEALKTQQVEIETLRHDLDLLTAE